MLACLKRPVIPSHVTTDSHSCLCSQSADVLPNANQDKHALNWKLGLLMMNVCHFMGTLVLYCWLATHVSDMNDIRDMSFNAALLTSL